MDAVTRTLPMRLDPVDGEALDSWLEAVSHRLTSAWGDFADAIGLPAPNGSSGTPWLARLTPSEAASVSVATRFAPTQLRMMTLDRYDGTGVAIRHDIRAVNRAFPWSRLRFSRFCPECLRDSGGRWQLFWRLGWAFACEEHQCLLIDECPVCGQRQRGRPLRADVVPNPGHCATQAADATGGAPARCGTDLSAAPRLRFPVDHPVLAVQHTIRAAIETGTATFGIYREHSVPAAAALADLRAVAGRILSYGTEAELRRILPADLHAAHFQMKAGSDDRGGPSRRGDKPGRAAPGHALIAAVGATAALGILGAPDIAAAGAALRGHITGARERGLAVSSSNVGWGKRSTHLLTATQLVALGPLMKLSDQLRHRIGAAIPTRPSHDHNTVAAVAAKLPAVLWPEWSLRLAPPRMDYQRLCTALSSATLLVNTRLSWTQASAAMGREGTGHTLSQTLQQLQASPQWDDIRTAIVRLADYLFHTTDCPIDYRRRRTLDYSSLLTPPAWQRICRDVDIRTGHGKKARMARCHLYSLVSGVPARCAPGYVDTKEFAAHLAAFPTLLTPRLVAALHDEARKFLEHHQVDEPVTWHPPLDLMSGLRPPGVDLETIDTTQLHRLSRQSLPLSVIAQRLDTSLDAVRYALTLYPSPDHMRSHGFRRAPVLTDLAKELSATTLADLYQEQKLSLRDIAALYGAEHKVVNQLARQYGIELRPARRPRQHEEIDRDWLYTEYIINRRPLPELAAEKGMSTTTMSRWANLHGIQRRAQGGPSHTATLNAADNAPETLRPALRQIGGAQRLARFVAASDFPTVTVAAETLGLCQPVLHGQITRLEAELGGPLLDRAQRGQLMAVTDLGARVLEAWATWNSGQQRKP